MSASKKKAAQYESKKSLNGKMSYLKGNVKKQAMKMIKRKDGSMSERGLWDNIRNKAAQNKKTGAKPKAPSKEMLAQEKKIKNKK